MKTKQLIVIAITATLAMAGCKKETHYGGPQPENPVNAIIDQNRIDATQTYTLDAAEGGTVFGADGTVITAQPNAFRTNSGGMVTGAVTIALLEAMGPADMVWLNLQTVAVQGGIKRQLESGGEVRVRAEAGGQQVTVAENAVKIYVPDPSPDAAMRRYVGEEDDDGNVLWEDDGELAIDNGIAVADSGGVGWVPGYYYTTPWPANAFGDPNWPPFAFINCDHPLLPGGDSTEVTITVPTDLAGWNTSVWIVLPAINCMVCQEIWVGSSVSAGFPVRVGLSGTIVALSQTSSGLYSAFVPITITQDHQQTITLAPTTLADYHLTLQSL